MIIIIHVGVIQCTNISGVKDMYMIPLQYDDPLPPQLLPFTGPGTVKALYMCLQHYMYIYVCVYVVHVVQNVHVTTCYDIRQ